MFGFIDESGDTGFKFGDGSSDYFVVSMVLFESKEEVDKVETCITELKTLSLKKPSMEFHFTSTTDSDRRKFFEAVSEFDFKVVAIVVNKTKLEEFKHEEFLLTSFAVAIEEAKKAGLLENATLEFDETGGNAFKKKLASSLMAQVNQEEKRRYVKQLKSRSSKVSNLIQLADMVCGAIARPHNSPDRKAGNYHEMIKHRIASVLEWP